MTTDPNATLDPTETGPQDGLDPTSADVRQDMTPATVSPYDVEVPVTLRQRLAYARALSQAGILPRDYASRPANVLVAGEMGRELGLSTVQSVMMLNVVEGRPTLGASGVRAVVLRAGHRMKVTNREYNDHGVCTSVTVTGWRYDVDGGEPNDQDTRTYTLAMAAQAGLVRLVKNDEGEVTAVRARSKNDNPLPWELHTERMMEARATTWLGDTLFADVTMGLSTDRDPEAPAIITTAEQVTTNPEPTPRAAAVLQQVKPVRRTDLPDEYDPAADLALFPDGDWWVAAGAQVSRRNAAQLAADRIAKWVADNPDQETVPLPPANDGDVSGAQEITRQVVESEAGLPPREPEVTVVCDYPACVLDQHDTGDHMDANGDVLVPEPEPVDPEPADDAPWTDPMPADDPTPDAAPAVDEPPADTMTDAGPDLDPVPEPEPPAADDGVAATAADLLAEIEAAATEVGKSRQALMVRWIASHRKNPEDATAEELLPFVEQLRETLAARRG